MKRPTHRLLLLLMLFLHHDISISQIWTKDLPPGATFFQVKEAFYKYYQSGQVVPREKENPMDEERARFARWEHYYKYRLDETGHPVNGGQILDEWANVDSKKSKQKVASPATWEFVGPAVLPSNGGGAGRINTMEFEPGNPSKIWVGSAGGGVWVTTTGGNSWTDKTPELPVLSIADIAIHPTMPDTVFIATGDNYGYSSSYGDFWGGTYSGGIFKTYNGGSTWDTAGLNSIQSNKRTIYKLLIHPTNPNILLASTTSGLYRSVNGSQSWTQITTSVFYDMEFRPGHFETIYASDKNGFFRSQDSGVTFTNIVDLVSSNGRTSIAVTPSNSLVVYFFHENGDFYKSSNSGASFSPKASPSLETTFYGYYDNVLAVSETNPNVVYCGGLNIVKSTNGGDTWSEITDWAGFPDNDYVHADNKDIQFLPGSGSTLFSCNDGGIFKTTNSGGIWEDLGTGLAIGQFYRVSTASTDPEFLLGGLQDNGVARKLDNTWKKVRGGDGMNVLINYLNHFNLYASTQYGAMRKSIDGGETFVDIAPDADGAWITPFVFHPQNPEILFAAYNEVFRSDNGGSDWNSISGNGISDDTDFEFIAICKTSPQHLYVGSDQQLFATSDDGANWTSIIAGLPISSSRLVSEVAVASHDPMKVWASISGYTAGEKVYFSSDGGNNWTNVSGSLPNVPVNCLIYQNNSPDLVYIGTDFGVYYKDSTMTDWVPFNDGLPFVNIADLEVNYTYGKLVAATYGKGIWKTPLAIEYNSISLKSEKPQTPGFFPNPVVRNAMVSDLPSGSKFQIRNLLGVMVYSGIADQQGKLTIDFSSFPAGIYIGENPEGKTIPIKIIHP